MLSTAPQGVEPGSMLGQEAVQRESSSPRQLKVNEEVNHLPNLLIQVCTTGRHQLQE